MRRDRSGRASPGIVVLVLVALAVGGAASLLAAAAPGTGAASDHYSEIAFPLWIVEAVVVVLIALAAFFLIRARTGSNATLPNRVAVTAIVTILVAVLVLFAFQGLSHLGNASGSGGTASAGDSSNGATNSTNATTNASVVPGSGTLLFLGPSTPPWAAFAVVGGIALVVSLLVTSPYWARAFRRARDRDERAPDEEIAAVRDAVEDASRALEAGGDPRTIVIRLYSTILVRIGPNVGDVERATPEEIRAIHLVRLGIRPSAAETLTRSFEEARYSSHPIPPAMVEGVTNALREASADLDRPR